MMFRQEWVSQPQQPVGIAQRWRQRGFVGAYLGNGLWVDTNGTFSPLANTANPTRRPAHKVGITSGFGSTDGSGTGHYQSGAFLPFPRSGTRSIVSHFKALSQGSNSFGRIFQNTSGSGIASAGDEALFENAANGFSYTRNDASTAASQWNIASALVTGVGWVSVGVSCVFGSNPLMYVNGVSQTVTNQATAATSSVPASGGFTIAFGNRPSDVARSWDGQIGVTLFFDGLLNGDEHLQLARNPWQVFAWTERALWVTTSGSGSTGTIAVTEANDTSSAAGTTTVVGTLANTEANDTSSASGTTTVTGTIAVTEANDTSAASGVAGAVTGTISVTEANDTSAASGWAGTVTGTISVTDENDTSNAQGATPAAQNGGGGWFPSLPTKREREDYIRRQREALGIIPKRIQPIAKTIKKIAKQAAKLGIEPSVEQVREIEAFQPIDTQAIADALAINYRIYLALLDKDRQERERTRQFIEQQIEQAKANAIQAARLQEEEEVFVVMSLLLAD